MTYLRDYHKEHTSNQSVDSHLIKKILRYLIPYKTQIIVCIVLLLLAKGFDAVVPALLGQLTNEILGESILFPSLYLHIGIVMGMLILSYIFEGSEIILKTIIGQKAILRLRQEVYGHLLHLPLKYYDKHTVGRLITRTIHDVDQIDQMFSESVIPILGNIFLFVIMLTLVLFLEWKIGILFLLLIPIVFWFTNKFRIDQRQCYEVVRSIVSALNGFVQENLMGVSTIRNFGLQKRQKEIFDEINEDYCTAYVESIHNFSFFIAAIDFLQGLALILAFVLISLTLPEGASFDAGMFLTFSLYMLMFFRPLADMTERYNILQSAVAASERVFDLLETQSEPISENPLPLTGIDSIEFSHVWFAYKDENWVIKDFSLKINQGESVAVVGATGAGKSTLMSLLLRYYSPQQGEILINGIDHKLFDLYELRKQFGVVLQDPVIFSGTIEENVRFYAPDILDERVQAACGEAGLNKLLSKLPKGIKQEIGEHGKTLSAGEKQLISVARALAHESTVILLDEATANIDSETEQVIQQVLKNILQGRTSLVIAHRLSTVKNSDRLIVMSDGQIVEQGTHEQLLGLKGVYEKLYRLQSQTNVTIIHFE